uniref:Uncharacterized protein n=1 Tax=Arundo donax TaxID=35708 RepID=A0A0A9CV49_ARUDO
MKIFHATTVYLFIRQTVMPKIVFLENMQYTYFIKKTRSTTLQQPLHQLGRNAAARQYEMLLLVIKRMI